jgi:hypothetical protein
MSSIKAVKFPPLKVVPTKRLRAGGIPPSEDMQPGQYVVSCESATLTTRGQHTTAVLQFRIIDGPHSGTALRQWLAVSDVAGVVSLESRYARHCAVALGAAEIEPGDELDPSQIFPNKVFLVEAGYRLTQKVGGSPDEENGKRRKDAKDFLRVHKILELRDG